MNLLANSTTQDEPSALQENERHGRAPCQQQSPMWSRGVSSPCRTPDRVTSHQSVGQSTNPNSQGRRHEGWMPLWAVLVVLCSASSAPASPPHCDVHCLGQHVMLGFIPLSEPAPQCSSGWSRVSLISFSKQPGACCMPFFSCWPCNHPWARRGQPPGHTEQLLCTGPAV